MIRLRNLRCSFCRKNESEVAKLVAGPRVYICDACVAIASRLMENDSHDDSLPSKDEPSIWRRLLVRAQDFLHRGVAQRVGSVGV